ncbi:cytochrome P450 [Thermomonospora umbrina]|uniref:Nocardicin N-oxygenase n=1 Tax=Thermomonospora umbrina TaxID=111806 RepID=A0A3D9SZC3_9ACTN|nr:cytochrome P450 [Thermomonospora umbrina]REE97924.1 nocardicin N-oxygenase [Thermomonospora umbrina]
MPRREACPYPFEGGPHPLALGLPYRQLQEKGPVAPVALPGGVEAWLVTGYEECRTVLQDPAFSRAEADGVAPFPVLSGLLLALDGDGHQRIRRVAQRGFSAGRVAGLRGQVEGLANELLDDMTGGRGSADLVHAFALPFALGTITRILGIDDADHARIRKWGDGLLASGPDAALRSAAAVEQMSVYVGGLVADRRAGPGDDLLSEVVSRADRAGLSDTELIMLVVALVIAGWETTAAAIATFTYTLLTLSTATGRSYYRYLHQHPEMIPSAVEELLRTVPNSRLDSQPRRALRDVVLGDVTVRAGDLVIAAQDAAGRDPGVFPDPDGFDIARNPNPHLAFGHGPHFCLGAHLGRLELQVALAALTERLPHLRPAVPVETLEWRTSTMIRCPERFPVTW